MDVARVGRRKMTVASQIVYRLGRDFAVEMSADQVGTTAGPRFDAGNRPDRDRLTAIQINDVAAAVGFICDVSSAIGKTIAVAERRTGAEPTNQSAR